MTIVHLLRHGEVENPQRILYGRAAGYHLSERGRAMAERAAEHFADVPLTHLRCSPLERAQETMAPVAALHPDLEIVLDERLIEAANKFEGRIINGSDTALKDPRMWWHMRNPLQPSWGEPYTEIATRMRAAIADAAAAAGPDGQALIVSHQLPIWTARRDAEGRSFVHDPRKRQCTLASVTSLPMMDGRVVRVDYAEPARDLLPVHKKTRLFIAGT